MHGRPNLWNPKLISHRLNELNESKSPLRSLLSDRTLHRVGNLSRGMLNSGHSQRYTPSLWCRCLNGELFIFFMNILQSYWDILHSSPPCKIESKRVSRKRFRITVTLSNDQRTLTVVLRSIPGRSTVYSLVGSEFLRVTRAIVLELTWTLAKFVQIRLRTNIALEGGAWKFNF